jgi:hypothetical protein
MVNPGFGNPNFIVPTPPAGDSSNRIATTKFVTNNGVTAINVEAFGADPTGNNDSTAAINAALVAGANASLPVYAAGNFLTAGPTYPGYPVTFYIAGQITLTSTWTVGPHWSIIGVVASNFGPPGDPLGTQPFGIGPHAYIEGNQIASGPPLRVIKSGDHYLANLVVHPNASSACVELNGTSPYWDGIVGSVCRMDNVIFRTSTTTNPSPCLLIDSFFWVWATRCRFLTGNASLYGIRITNSDSTNGVGRSGLIYFDDYIIAANPIAGFSGISIDSQVGTPGGTIGNCVFRNGFLEWPNVTPPAGCSAVLLDGSGPGGYVGNVVFDSFGLADPASGPLTIKGRVDGLTLSGFNNLKNTILLDPATNGGVTGLVMDSQGTTGGVPSYIAGFSEDFILGSLLGIGDTQAPSMHPIVPQQIIDDASLWNGIGAANVTVTYGITAPDGTPTAGQVYNTSTGSIDLTLGSFNITPAVGDIVIIGGWIQNPNFTTKQLHPRCLHAQWTNAGVTFDPAHSDGGPGVTVGTGNTDAGRGGFTGQWGVGEWIPCCSYATITATPGGAQTLNVAITTTTNTAPFQTPINVWRPFCYYIPVGSMPADEVIRFTQSVRRGVIKAIAGDIAVHDHQRIMLGGGVRLNSAAAQPTKGVYAVGDRTFNSTAAGGWTCTAAGGAFSVTRNAAAPTAYATGVWANWSTGNTVVECTIAGTNSGAAATAPTTVGQTVTDGTVTWVCRSLSKATFSASL